MTDGSILIVEDDEAQRSLLATFVRKQGYEVRTCGSAAEARRALAEAMPAVVLTDYNLGDADGLAVLRAAREQDPAVAVLLITAYGTVGLAVEAMRDGAFDVMLKPVDPDALLERVGRAMRLRSLETENVRLRRRLHLELGDDAIVAESGAMNDLLATVRRVAGTKTTVLVTGETGTGKELIANLLHQWGVAPDAPFVALNCAALPESLLESELFGHVRGAFTGAVADRAGRFEQAEGGTLFLDELGEIPPAMQVRLLRVLEEREIVRVGENRVRPVDVRLVAATNRDLEAEVTAGRFREDLYFRLNVLRVHIPPLREHPEDIPALVRRFSSAFARDSGIRPLEFSAAALNVLQELPLRGNVRELRNLVERALVLAPGPHVEPGDLVTDTRASGGPPPSDEALGLEDAVAALERRMIREALRAARGVQTHAAARLGVAERVLRYKMQKYGMRRDAFGDAP